MPPTRKPRGRRPFLEVDSAIAMIEHFIRYFREPQLPAWSSDVWQQMSKFVDGKWDARAVYTNVRENRREILSKARANKGIIIAQDINNNPLCMTDYLIDEETLIDSEEEASTTHLEDGTTEFDLVLTKDEWAAIKPNKSTKDKEDEKFVLKPNVWTNIVATAFFRQFRMPCAIMFKGHNINTSQESKYFLTMKGYCSSKKCGSRFYGYAAEDPGDEELILKVRTRDTRDLLHEPVKRPLNGILREVVSKELREKGCSACRKDQARKKIRPGETEGPLIPNPATARQAKREGIYKEFEIKLADGRDLISSIEEMSARPPYAGFIHAVGSQPFYVFYSALTQLHAYKEYCRLNKKNSVISIDATGSLVQKLTRENGTKSSHIFLYAIVINFDKTSLSVHQMLSEQHDTEFITYWLRQWLRKGAPKPIEAVCDYSRALLSALCLAFNDMTIKRYLDICFNFLIRAKSAHGLEAEIHTRIRVDVAHLTHLACRWKCWNSITHRTVRDFFIHCLALMVDSQTVPEFEEIFLLTCTVALQEHDDNEVDLVQAFTAKEARGILESRIVVKGIVLDTEQKNNPDKELTQSTLDSGNPVESVKIVNKCQSPIRAWIDQLLLKAKVSKHDGKVLNAYYVPNLIDNLKRLAYEFLLWTGVTVPDRAGHASSACVEGVFKDLKKNTLKSFAPPIRIDLFLTIHARDLIGETALLSSKFVKFNIERFTERDQEQNKAFIQPRDATAEAVAVVTKKQAYSSLPLKRKTSMIMTSKGDDNQRETDSGKESNDKTENSICPVSPKPDLKADDRDRYNCKDVIDFDDPKLNYVPATSVDIQSNSVGVFRGKQRALSNIGQLKTMTKDARQLNLPSNKYSTCGSAEKSTETISTVGLNLESGSTIVSNSLSSPVGTVPSRDVEISMVASNMSFMLHDDSDMFSQENWRGKAGELEQLDLFAIDEVLNADPQAFPELDAAIGILVNSTMNSSYLEQIAATVLADHSYNKLEQDGGQLVIENTDDGIGSNCTNKKISDDRAVVKQARCIKKPTKFYDPCPKMRWKNDPTMKRRKACLLPNGGSITIDRITIFLYNTCAFDSIVHALMTSAIDDPWYASIIEKSENTTLQLVHKLITHGCTQEVLRDRMKIIKQYKDTTPEMRTKYRVLSYSINAEDSLAGTWNMLFKESEPSAYRIVDCKLCGNNSHILNIPSLTVNHKIIASRGFTALQTALSFYERIFNVRCVYGDCPGNEASIVTLNNHCIYIELDIRMHPSATMGMECTLDDLPTILELNVKYKLTAVLAYRVNIKHFVTYCRRFNGKWQCYDDLKTKSQWSSSSTKIVPHGAIYIVDKR